MFWLLGASLSLANLPRHCASGLGALHGYTYDAVADILSIGDSAYSGAASAAISGVSYDNLHRLLGFTRPGTSQTVTCTYDAIGDMLTNSENGSAAYTYSTPSGTHLPHAVKTANGLNYTYDLCGNMLTRGSQALVYNPENRLIASAVSNQVTTFGYDAGGNRLWKQGALTNTLQVWIEGIYEEKDGKILFHISAGDRIVYTHSSDGSVAEYYHPDNLHSAEILSSSSGSLYQHYEYSAYGNSRYTLSTSAFPISRRFTSQVLDEETGLYYYGARYYDPVIGRFIQPDTLIPNPFDPQSYDRYAYARDNPFRYVDPTGHSWVDYLPFRSSYLEMQGKNALDAMVQAHTDYGSYKQYMAAQQGAAPTAGDMGAVSATAHLAGEATTVYIAVAQEIATAGIGTGVTALTTAERTVGEEAGAGIVDRAEVNTRAATPKEGIYEFPDAQNPGKTYVGQSGNLPQRLKTHELTGRKAADTSAEVTAVPGGKTQREVAEQNRIDKLGGTRGQPGSQTSNVRNPISPQRKEQLNLPPTPAPQAPSQ